MSITCGLHNISHQPNINTSFHPLIKHKFSRIHKFITTSTKRTKHHFFKYSLHKSSKHLISTQVTYQQPDHNYTGTLVDQDEEIKEHHNLTYHNDMHQTTPIKENENIKYNQNELINRNNNLNNNENLSLVKVH